MVDIARVNLGVVGGEKRSVSVDDFTNKLLESGFKKNDIDDALSMINIGKKYNFADVKDKTGIDISGL